MKKQTYIALILLLLLSPKLQAQDSLVFKGQISSWMLYANGNDLKSWFGIRYIPQLNYQIALPENQLIDFEASANIAANIGTNFKDSTATDGQVKPYRAWMRYSGKQFELRVGLQKINFGAANMFRPLMWFEEVDARDPLKLTDGVWGLLGRYYFLNNANIWAWVLYGNEKPRGWEFNERDRHTPEFGGRIQLPFSNSELGFSYHHQIIKPFLINETQIPTESYSENKFGFDLKIDWYAGWWLEVVWSAKNAQIGLLKNQEMLTLGADYTFGIGNGLYWVAEHFLASNDENAFEFNRLVHFTATSFSYPIGLFDHLNAVFYYDWTNHSVYNFMNWQKQINKWSFYVMAYWNPENTVLPTAGNSSNLYSGKGIQLMLIFNH